MAEDTKYEKQIAQEENDDELAKIKDSGKTAVYTPTTEEKAAWKKEMVKVHTEMERRIGKDKIQAVYKETGFKPD